MTVNRWHHDPDPALRNSGDTIERHQRAVLGLVLDLAPRIGLPLHDSDLPNAARWHDEGERMTGDISRAAKQRFPALASALAEAESEALAALAPPGYPWSLSEREAALLALCDAAEAWLWAASHTDTDVPRWIDDWRHVSRLARDMDPALEGWWQDVTEATMTSANHRTTA